MAASEISQRFSAADADITIASSDGVLFKLHRKNLEFHSDIFANAADTTPRDADSGAGDIMQLSESADVLDLLFQYMYRQPQPVLKDVQFEVCAGLAEAAENVPLFSRKLEQLFLPKILGSGGKAHSRAFQCQEICEKADAARLSMGLPVAQAVKTLTPDTFVKWAEFYDYWHERSRAILATYCIRDKDAKADNNTVAVCITEHNPCYTHRAELRKITRNGYALDLELNKLLEIKFTCCSQQLSQGE
ncbi:hypothetical protein B0H16DRAFT_1842785 [Mycena metata]|uniref:BTB domain-containing protein n=1 Tax=Mycena metata TaxID=1033252 RepID=A0AAD7IWB1_9AGAR|nr:hypothetical protein B0H16DRAFT_1842785 [Mycena metata]